MVNSQLYIVGGLATIKVDGPLSIATLPGQVIDRFFIELVGPAARVTEINPVMAAKAVIKLPMGVDHYTLHFNDGVEIRNAEGTPVITLPVDAQGKSGVVIFQDQPFTLQAAELSGAITIATESAEMPAVPEDSATQPAQIYLAGGSEKITVTGKMEIKPMLGQDVSGAVIQIEAGGQANVDLNIAGKVSYNLAAAADYQYQVDPDNGVVLVKDAAGNTVVSLPVDGTSGETPAVAIGNGTAAKIEVDFNTLEIKEESIPQPGEEEEIPDPGPVYTLHEAQYGATVAAQTLTGVDGELDIFVLNFKSDPNGGFATFGELTIGQYNQEDGDLIVLVDGNNAWGEISDFTNAVQRNAGDARIIFSNNPAETFFTQWLQINGAETAGAFAQKPADIGGVDFLVATAADVALVGTVTDYINEFLAG